MAYTQEGLLSPWQPGKAVRVFTVQASVTAQGNPTDAVISSASRHVFQRLRHFFEGHV